MGHATWHGILLLVGILLSVYLIDIDRWRQLSFGGWGGGALAAARTLISFPRAWHLGTKIVLRGGKTGRWKCLGDHVHV